MIRTPRGSISATVPCRLRVPATMRHRCWWPMEQLPTLEDRFHDDHFHILDHFPEVHAMSLSSILRQTAFPGGHRRSRRHHGRHRRRLRVALGGALADLGCQPVDQAFIRPDRRQGSST